MTDRSRHREMATRGGTGRAGAPGRHNVAAAGAHRATDPPASARAVGQPGRMLPQAPPARGGPRRALADVPLHPQTYGRRTPGVREAPTHVRPTPRSTLRHAVMARATSPPAPLGLSVPMRLGIPALGLRTAIEPVGLCAGALDVPTHVWHVGWFITWG